MAETDTPVTGDTSPILTHRQGGVTTLIMNRPAQLNGWTMEMLDALKEGFRVADADNSTKVVILTAEDPYYCAGVNLSSTLRLGHPRKLRDRIMTLNQALFDLFLDYPKPILVAVNGPAIGASVTSATLCDGIIASERASFSTPFAALSVPPEGCSSVHFKRLMGQTNADRMLGAEGWKPTAEEALVAGLVQWVVPHERLREEAGRIAREWIAAGAVRSLRAGATREELKAVNARESAILADAFLGAAFLKAQFRFLWRKKKWGPAAMFMAMLISRPLWSLLL